MILCFWVTMLLSALSRLLLKRLGFLCSIPFSFPSIWKLCVSFISINFHPLTAVCIFKHIALASLEWIFSFHTRQELLLIWCVSPQSLSWAFIHMWIVSYEVDRRLRMTANHPFPICAFWPAIETRQYGELSFLQLCPLPWQREVTRVDLT